MLGLLISNQSKKSSDSTYPIIKMGSAEETSLAASIGMEVHGHLNLLVTMWQMKMIA